MSLTKIRPGDADPATGGNPETGRLNEAGGLYIFPQVTLYGLFF